MDSPRLTPLAITVLEKRYLRKNTQGVVIETPDEMFWRVARDMAEAERLYKNPSSIDELSKTFHELMSSHAEQGKSVENPSAMINGE